MIFLDLLALAASLAGCTTFGVTDLVRVREGEIHFRECQMTVWTAVVATGYHVHDCEDKFFRYAPRPSVARP
ncbi:MAG: hypothetical protein AB1411_07025 [Nitrospirota bacterium]